MKKIKLILLFTIVFSCNSFSQKNYSATYTYENLESKNNPLLSVLLNSVKYELISDGFYTRVSAIIQDNKLQGVELKKSGATTSIFDIEKNLVNLNSEKELLFQYDLIDFKIIKKDTLVNNFKCDVLKNENNDLLYISKKIPNFINPFYLNAESIKWGVAKAVLMGSGTYTLTNIIKTKTLKKISFPKVKKIKKQKNPFFS